MKKLPCVAAVLCVCLGVGAQFTLQYSLAASQRVVLELFSAQGR